MPSTTLKAIPSTNWYCHECAIDHGYEPGLIKETQPCAACGESKLCTHAMQIEKSYVSRTRIGQVAQPANPNQRVCPDCGNTIDYLNYSATGCYSRGNYYFTDGGYHEMDECDEDGAEYCYQCPDCGYEASSASAFRPADSVGDEDDNDDDEDQTKGGDSV